MTALHRDLERSVERYGAREAVVDPDGTVTTYGELNALAARMGALLAARGVVSGDRVGLFIRKTTDTVAAIFGTLRAGAAYVPVDVTAPASRAAFIFSDARARVVIVDEGVADALQEAMAGQPHRPQLVRIPNPGGGRGVRALVDDAGIRGDDARPGADVEPEDLACILYTSGSTGKPKGVKLSHRNTTSFVAWCSRVFEPTPNDRFTSHAPFHFDLSVLDLYVSLKHGARLSIIGEDLAKDPLGLSRLVQDHAITNWYSAPSILTMLLRFGKLDEHDHSSLRTVLFAGEVFPIGYLRELMGHWKGPRYYNLYGPTETNVCTYYRVPGRISPDRSEPLPIGAVCEHLEGIVVDEDGQVVATGTKGELCIHGDNVTQGYWNLEDLTAKAFLTGPDGRSYYRTGDLVVEAPGGEYLFHGRRDRMVKRRGYRIELGEVESCLYHHPDITEVAIVSVPGPDDGVHIVAHYASKTGSKLSVIQLKRYCSEKIPVYMIPDRFSFHESLPKTSTDKIDYQKLKSGG